MKLTKEQRAQIKARYWAFKKVYDVIKKDNMDNLSKEFGITNSRVHSIIHDGMPAGKWKRGAHNE